MKLWTSCLKVINFGRMEYLLNRLREPSSWRGIFALLTAVGLKLHPELQEAILSVGLSAIGLVNFFRKEKNDSNPPANP
jgi:hypothetical protein